MVLAVGFGESGDEGRALQEVLRLAGQESGVRIVGPNTSGMLNLEKGVNLVGARGVRPGGLAVLVQSGNMALALMTEVTERSWDGISIYLGVGNEVDLGFAEALAYLEGHDGTRAVVAYVEGLRDAGAFLEIASRVSRTKPVVLLKSGRTVRGAEAALSHTGSVTGSYDRLRAALAQAGVVELTRGDELLHVAETLGRQPASAPGTGIAILSDGGGQGTLAVDMLVESGARMAELAPSTRAALRRLLGPAAAVANPVDLAGAADADPEVFARATELLVADAGVGVVLVIGLFGGYGIRFADSLTEGERAGAVAMADHARAAGCGLVVHTMYALHRSPPLADLGSRGVPVVASLEVACRCAAELQRRGAWLERAPWEYVRPDGAGEGAAGRRALTEPEARALLAELGMPFEPAIVVDSADGVVRARAELGRPVAVKLVSAGITHKTDVGGVVLGVDGEESARRAFETIARRVGARTKGEPLRVLVTPMLPTPRVELLVGGYRDPDLGPVVAVGAGGVWVEELSDVAVRVLPVDDRHVEEMLDELRIGGLLCAGRGFRAVDRSPILASVRAVAGALEGQVGIAEVEVNPLFVYENRVAAVDARVVLSGAP